MRVERVELYHVEVPMRAAFRSGTSSSSVASHILVRFSAGDGISGWGEAPTPADPYYVGETPASVWSIIKKYLAPMVLALQWEHPSEVSVSVARVKGNPLARSCVEMAAWDIWCRARGVSLSCALGEEAAMSAGALGVLGKVPAGAGSRGSSVPAGATLGLEGDTGRLIEQVDECVGQGYGRVKIKIAPGSDVEALAAVTQRYPDLAVVADANGAYRLEDQADLAALRYLDELRLLAIEQPLGDDDLVGHARLQEMLKTTIALDEAITSPKIAEAAIAIGSCKAISIKSSRLGGLSAALAVLDLCRKAGIGAWCGGMHELGLGRAANVALASQTGFTMPGDMAGSDRYFDEDLVGLTARVENGAIRVPVGAGIGVEIDVAAILRHCVGSAVIE